jgi:hypothetical protein
MATVRTMAGQVAGGRYQRSPVAHYGAKAWANKGPRSPFGTIPAGTAFSGPMVLSDYLRLGLIAVAMIGAGLLFFAGMVCVAICSF